MINHSTTIVQKHWNHCDVLRNAGLAHGDYVEQLIFPLSLKMPHEQAQPRWNRPSPVPAGYDWPSIIALAGDALEKHRRKTVEDLGEQIGMQGALLLKAWNKSQDPALLRRLIAYLIDREQRMILGGQLRPRLARDVQYHRVLLFGQ
jgi:type I restriction enzyme M protein